MGYELHEGVSSVRCREEHGMPVCYLEDENGETVKRHRAEKVQMTGTGFMNMTVEDDGFSEGWSVFSPKNGGTLACNVGDNTQGEEIVSCELQR